MGPEEKDAFEGRADGFGVRSPLLLAKATTS
jgi:hypothetical protein